MSNIVSSNHQVGQNATASLNITLNTDTNGDLVINKGVYPTLTEISRFPNSGFVDYVDDAAAATGGVPVGSFYRTGSVIKVRVA